LHVGPARGQAEEPALSKRVCESCRFFEAAGKDSMGWCHHPKRKTGSDIRLYVRAAELPCRDDWNRDLWASRDGAEGGDRLVANNVGPLPPATPAHMSSLAAVDNQPKPAYLTASGEDVVVGEAPSRQSDTAGGPGRGELRRAREQIKQLNRGTRPPGPLFGTVGSDRLGAGSAGEFGPRVRATDGTGVEVAPVRPDEIPRPFPGMTSFADDDARFSSVPPVRDDVELPRRTVPPPVPSGPVAELGAAAEPAPAVDPQPPARDVEVETLRRPLETAVRPPRQEWMEERSTLEATATAAVGRRRTG
jgi:hypothetical protein